MKKIAKDQKLPNQFYYIKNLIKTLILTKELQSFAKLFDIYYFQLNLNTSNITSNLDSQNLLNLTILLSIKNYNLKAKLRRIKTFYTNLKIKKKKNTPKKTSYILEIIIKKY